MTEAVEARQPCRIVLVEDNPADVRLLTIACADRGIPISIRVFEDGESALSYVQEDSPELPDLVILDINLPRVAGHNVLAAARANPRLANTPIVVLTTSRSPHDRESAERLGANLVLNKPNDFDEFCDTVENVVKTYC